MVEESLDGIEAVFLDLDGTLYLGNTLIEGALDFLGRLESRGIRRFFLSNNSSKSVGQYLDKLGGLGIDASEEEILLSTLFFVQRSLNLDCLNKFHSPRLTFNNFCNSAVEPTKTA